LVEVISGDERELLEPRFHLHDDLWLLAAALTTNGRGSRLRDWVRPARGHLYLEPSWQPPPVHPAKDGQATYEFKWVNPGGFETASQPEKGFFAGNGWFAFIESPTRIWLYDGKRQLNIVHRKEKGVSIYSVAAKDYFNSCPAEVWAVLPEAVRERLQQAGQAAVKP